MKQSTQIIGLSILLITGVSLFFLSKKGNKNIYGKYLDDEPINGTYSDVKEIAKQLHILMKDNGSDNNAIMKTFIGINSSKLKEIIKAFGVKPYNTLFGNQLTIYGKKLPLLGLKTWLKEELSERDYSILKIAHPKIL